MAKFRLKISIMNRTAVGALLIIVGLAFLGRNLGWFPYFSFHLFRWPNFMFLIAIGLAISGKYQPAGIIAIVGGIFWLRKNTYLDWELIWPLALIIGGMLIFIRKTRSNNQEEIDTNETGKLDQFIMFSGSEKNMGEQVFRGGKSTTLFGGTEIDLSSARLVDNVTLDLFCMFGGVEITVPPHWIVNVDATPIFGGVSDGRSSEDQDGPVLQIKGFVMFGGVEVRS